MRDLIDLTGELREHDGAEQLVLFQNLIGVEPLRMSQGAELASLRDNRNLGIELLSRIGHIVGNPLDEQRNVVQQLFGGEYPLRTHGHSRCDALEPARYDLDARDAESFAKCLSECQRWRHLRPPCETITSRTPVSSGDSVNARQLP